jgi:hypothetical protein
LFSFNSVANKVPFRLLNVYSNFSNEITLLPTHQSALSFPKIILIL